MDPQMEDRILDSLSTLNNKLDDLHGDFREFRGIITTKVASLEKDRDNENLWTNVKVIAVLPVVAALHILASKVGLIK